MLANDAFLISIGPVRKYLKVIKPLLRDAQIKAGELLVYRSDRAEIVIPAAPNEANMKQGVARGGILGRLHRGADYWHGLFI